MKRILILGAGCAGLGAANEAERLGYRPTILEQNDGYGGLCDNFTIKGFRFDKFVHFSFTKNQEIAAIFDAGAPEVYRHIPNPFNIYKGKWIKHPAQNNLFPLDEDEKKKIIADFRSRPVKFERPKNYEEWLRIQYGDYFAEHFPMVYTRKYWMCEAKTLRTEWVGDRMYRPSVDEVIAGSETADTPVTYYAKEMRYPVGGGV